MQLLTRWATRSRWAYPGFLLGILQGGMYEALRDESLDKLKGIDFQGYAIGGLSVGEPQEDRERVMRHITPKLPADKPPDLMGMGTPEDLIRAVGAGVDMFHRVLPTRNARNGSLFTRFRDVQIRN